MGAWSVTSYPIQSGTTPKGDRVERFTVIAVSADRQRVIHASKLSADEVERFDPELEWSVR